MRWLAAHTRASARRVELLRQDRLGGLDLRGAAGDGDEAGRQAAALEPRVGDRLLPCQPSLGQRELLRGAGTHAGQQGALDGRAGLLRAPAHATRGAWQRRPSPTCQIGTPRRRAGGSVARSAIVTSTWPRSRSSSSSALGPVRVELGEDVVEQDDRASGAVGAEQVGLGQLQGQDDRALLAAAGVRRDVAPGELDAQVVSMRPDQADAVPELLLARPRRSAGGRPPQLVDGGSRAVAGRPAAPARRP